MVELMVVLVIIAIVSASAIGGIYSSRSTGRALAARSAAHAYAQAADEFARSHLGRYPAAPGSTEWGSGTAARLGPYANLFGDRRYFLRQVPENVQSGSVTLGTSGNAAIEYRQFGGGTGYQVILRVTGRPTCAFVGGNATLPAGTKECSRR